MLSEAQQSLAKPSKAKTTRDRTLQPSLDRFKTRNGDSWKDSTMTHEDLITRLIACLKSGTSRVAHYKSSAVMVNAEASPLR